MSQSYDPNAPDYVNPNFTTPPQAQPQVTGYTEEGIPIYASTNDASHLSQGTWRGGVTNDVGRYRGMATGGPQHGPTIAQPDQARGIGMDAISLLRQRAEGGMTPAQMLARQQTAGAVSGIQSGAASIKGGAGARAAAARGAMATTARVGAQGAQDEQALRAREMADGANSFFGASTDLRGRETTLATEQAKLEAQQREANAKREEVYEGMAQDTKYAALGASMGKTASEQAAEDASRRAGQAESAQAWNNFKDIGGAATGGAKGGVEAYDKATRPYDPNDPNRTGSDERMKRDVHPISDKEAKRLKSKADGMIAATKAHKDTGPSVGRAPYDGKYIEPGTSGGIIHDDPYGSAPTPPMSLDEAMVQAGEGGDPYARTPEAGSLFGGRMGQTAERGYATARKGHAGYMFGGAPEATYAPLVDHHAGQAPGTGDFYGGSGHLSREDRDIALSDPKAKQEAFFAGQRHAVQGLGFDDMPSYAKAEAPKNASERRQPESAPREAPDANIQADRKVKPANPTSPLEHNAELIKKQIIDKRPEPGAPLPALPLQALHGTADIADAYREFPDTPVGQAAAGVPGYFGGLAGRARAMVSDERTKTEAHGSPMADANRSMSPSSYEYKPEFAAAEGQKPGEVNVGPMANKMEADPVAKTAIVKDPQTGLMAIDKTKGLKLVMGGLADLQRQVDRMKGARQ